MEELLVQEMRGLGQACLSQWAAQAEEETGKELKARDSTVRSRKKNADVGERVWIGGGAGAHLAEPVPELPPTFARATGGHPEGTFPAAGPGVGRLWLRAFICQGGGECAGALWLCDWIGCDPGGHAGTCGESAKQAAKAV